MQIQIEVCDCVSQMVLLSRSTSLARLHKAAGGAWQFLFRGQCVLSAVPTFQFISKQRLSSSKTKDDGWAKRAFVFDQNQTKWC